MNKVKNVFLIFILYLVLSQYGFILAQRNSGPPRIEKNVCPFEGCQLGKWIVRDTIKVYNSEGDTTSIKYFLAPGDTITALYGNVHYEKFGKVLVTRSFGNFAANDTVNVLRCTEGVFIVYYNGKRTYTDMFWPYDEEDGFGEQYNNEVHYGKMVERPQIAWWVKILKDDTEGWISLRNLTPYCFRIKEKIDGMDAFE